MNDIKKLVDTVKVQSVRGLTRLEPAENFYQARAMLKIQAEQTQSKEIQEMAAEIKADATPANLYRLKGLVEALIATGYQ